MRALVILGAGLVILAGGIAAWMWTSSPTGTATVGTVSHSGVALVGGPFELTDHNGERRRYAEFDGQYRLIYFGYTFCPDVCPLALGTMTNALDLLGSEADTVTPMFITVDPARDTVEQIKAYAEHFHPRLVALTGSEAEILETATAFRVYVSKQDSDDYGDYLVDHTSIVYLMDRDGAYLAHFSHGVPAQDMADGIAPYLN